MPKSAEQLNDELDQILGGGNFVKSDDLIDTRFMIHGFAMVDVEGYDSQAANVQVTVAGDETQWSTFSEVIIEQLEKLKKAKKFPCEVGLKSVASTKRKGKSYLRLIA